jgi:hypothetical protein
MKHLCCLLLLALSCASVVAAPRVSVTTDTNGVLVAPIGFFQANSQYIQEMIDTAVGLASTNAVWPKAGQGTTAETNGYTVTINADVTLQVATNIAKAAAEVATNGLGTAAQVTAASNVVHSALIASNALLQAQIAASTNSAATIGLINTASNHLSAALVATNNLLLSQIFAATNGMATKEAITNSILALTDSPTNFLLISANYPTNASAYVTNGGVASVTATNATHLEGVDASGYVKTSATITVVTNPVTGTYESQSPVPVVFPNGVGGSTRFLLMGYNEVRYGGTNFPNLDAAFESIMASTPTEPTIMLSPGRFPFTNELTYPGLRIIGAGSRATTLVHCQTNYHVGPANPRFGMLLTNHVFLKGFSVEYGYDTNAGFSQVFLGNLAGGDGFTNVVLEDIHSVHTNFTFLSVGHSLSSSNTITLRNCNLETGAAGCVVFAVSAPCTFIAEGCRFKSVPHNILAENVSVTLRNCDLVADTINVTLRAQITAAEVTNVVLGCTFRNLGAGGTNLYMNAQALGNFAGALHVDATIANDLGIRWNHTKLTNWVVNFSSWNGTNYSWSKSQTTITNW